MRQKHRTKPSGTYFVTANTWQRQRVFQRELTAEILEQSIIYYRNQGKFLLHSYVIMPDHFYLILTPGESTTLEKTMQLIKGGSSHRIGAELGRSLPVWQAGFSEHQIRDERDFRQHVAYIHSN